MTSLHKDEDDVVLHLLSQTRYACSSLSTLATRPANFVYRGVLIEPLAAKDGSAAVTSVIVKHSTDSVHTVIMSFLLFS